MTATLTATPVRRVMLISGSMSCFIPPGPPGAAAWPPHSTLRSSDHTLPDHLDADDDEDDDEEAAQALAGDVLEGARAEERAGEDAEGDRRGNERIDLAAREIESGARRGGDAD